MLNMPEGNKERFYEMLHKCEHCFGDRIVEGRAMNIIGAFESDTIEEFAGSRERDLNALSLLCTIKEMLSKESPDSNMVLKMYEKFCNFMHI